MGGADIIIFRQVRLEITMLRLVFAVMFAAVALSSGIAQAIEGVVVATTRGCSGRYVVETLSGFTLLEWFGGADPSKGDKVIGDLHSFGMKDLLVNGRSSRAWVDDYMLSRDRVIEKLRDRGCEW